MNLRALLTRLEKLEAASPAPVAAIQQPSGSLAMSLAFVIEDAARFEKLSPREQCIELRTDLRQAIAHKNTPPKTEIGRRLIALDFDDVTTEQLRSAELRLLKVLGHPGATHPLLPELREVIDLELFDA